MLDERTFLSNVKRIRTKLTAQAHVENRRDVLPITDTKVMRLMAKSILGRLVALNGALSDEEKDILAYCEKHLGYLPPMKVNGVWYVLGEDRFVREATKEETELFVLTGVDSEELFLIEGD